MLGGREDVCQWLPIMYTVGSQEKITDDITDVQKMSCLIRCRIRLYVSHLQRKQLSVCFLALFSNICQVSVCIQSECLDS